MLLHVRVQLREVLYNKSSECRYRRTSSSSLVRGGEIKLLFNNGKRFFRDLEQEIKFKNALLKQLKLFLGDSEYSYIEFPVVALFLLVT